MSGNMIPYPRLCAVLVPVLLCCAPHARAASDLLLVVNKGNGTLSIVDPVSCKQIAAVDEKGITGHEVAASPDGKLAYVPIYSSAGVGRPGTDGTLIRVIDLATHAIVGTIDFGHGIRPHRPVIGPKNGLLYVTTELDQSVSIIDPATLRVIGSVPTGYPQSHMLAISSDGTRGYTANVSSGTVSVLDLDARKLITAIPVATIVQRIALSVDNRWAFTADQTKARLAVIDTATNAVSTSIPLPGLAFGTAPTPDGKWLLVALPALSMVGVVDLQTMHVVRRIDVPKAPQEILVRPDGAVAYVSCDSSAKVAVLDLTAWSVQGLINVGPTDDGLAWAPGR
jgi:YVTN family beta-propeller protein